MSHDSDLLVSAPMRIRLRVKTRPVLKASSNYLPICPPTGSRLSNLWHVHRQTSPSSLGLVPTNPLPPFPRHHLLFHMSDPCHPHPAYPCWAPRQISQSCGIPTELRDVFRAIPYPPSRFSHPSISKLYLGPSGYRCRSSLQSTRKFPPSPGATST